MSFESGEDDFAVFGQVYASAFELECPVGFYETVDGGRITRVVPAGYVTLEVVIGSDAVWVNSLTVTVVVFAFSSESSSPFAFNTCVSKF